MGDPIVNVISGDGAFFRNTGGVISIVFRKAGVETIIVEASFNGSAITGLDNTFIKDEDFHSYEILYTLGQAEFFQDGKLIHSIEVEDVVAVETLHLPMFSANRNVNGNIVDNTFTIKSLTCSRLGSALADPDSRIFNSPESVLVKNSPGKLVSIIITDTGVGGANIELHDSLDGLGTSFVTVSLTSSLIVLSFNRPFDTGLFIVSSGTSFEVIVNWR